MPKKPPIMLAYVRWRDSSYQRGECTREELERGVELESAGLLIEEDEDGISIALDRYAGDAAYRHIESIPKACIIEVKKVKVPGS